MTAKGITQMAISRHISKNRKKYNWTAMKTSRILGTILVALLINIISYGEAQVPVYKPAVKNKSIDYRMSLAQILNMPEVKTNPYNLFKSREEFIYFAEKYIKNRKIYDYKVYRPYEPAAKPTPSLAYEYVRRILESLNILNPAWNGGNEIENSDGTSTTSSTVNKDVSQLSTTEGPLVTNSTEGIKNETYIQSTTLESSMAETTTPAAEGMLPYDKNYTSTTESIFTIPISTTEAYVNYTSTTEELMFTSLPETTESFAPHSTTEAQYSTSVETTEAVDYSDRDHKTSTESAFTTPANIFVGTSESTIVLSTDPSFPTELTTHEAVQSTPTENEDTTTTSSSQSKTETTSASWILDSTTADVFFPTTSMTFVGNEVEQTTEVSAEFIPTTSENPPGYESNEETTNLYFSTNFTFDPITNEQSTPSYEVDNNIDATTENEYNSSGVILQYQTTWPTLFETTTYEAIEYSPTDEPSTNEQTTPSYEFNSSDVLSQYQTTWPTVFETTTNGIIEYSTTDESATIETNSASIQETTTFGTPEYSTAENEFNSSGVIIQYQTTWPTVLETTTNGIIEYSTTDESAILETNTASFHETTTFDTPEHSTAEKEFNSNGVIIQYQTTWPTVFETTTDVTTEYSTTDILSVPKTSPSAVQETTTFDTTEYFTLENEFNSSAIMTQYQTTWPMVFETTTYDTTKYSTIDPYENYSKLRSVAEDSSPATVLYPTTEPDIPTTTTTGNIEYSTSDMSSNLDASLEHIKLKTDQSNEFEMPVYSTESNELSISDMDQTTNLESIMFADAFVPHMLENLKESVDQTTNAGTFETTTFTDEVQPTSDTFPNTEETTTLVIEAAFSEALEFDGTTSPSIIETTTTDYTPTEGSLSLTATEDASYALVETPKTLDLTIASSANVDNETNAEYVPTSTTEIAIETTSSSFTPEVKDDYEETEIYQTIDPRMYETTTVGSTTNEGSSVLQDMLGHIPKEGLIEAATIIESTEPLDIPIKTLQSIDSVTEQEYQPTSTMEPMVKAEDLTGLPQKLSSFYGSALKDDYEYTMDTMDSTSSPHTETLTVLDTQYTTSYTEKVFPSIPLKELQSHVDGTSNRRMKAFAIDNTLENDNSFIPDTELANKLDQFATVKKEFLEQFTDATISSLLTTSAEFPSSTLPYATDTDISEETTTLREEEYVTENSPTSANFETEAFTLNIENVDKQTSYPTEEPALEYTTETNILPSTTVIYDSTEYPSTTESLIYLEEEINEGTTTEIIPESTTYSFPSTTDFPITTDESYRSTTEIWEEVAVYEDDEFFTESPTENFNLTTIRNSPQLPTSTESSDTTTETLQEAPYIESSLDSTRESSKSLTSLPATPTYSLEDLATSTKSYTATTEILEDYSAKSTTEPPMPLFKLAANGSTQLDTLAESSGFPNDISKKASSNPYKKFSKNNVSSMTATAKELTPSIVGKTIERSQDSELAKVEDNLELLQVITSTIANLDIKTTTTLVSEKEPTLSTQSSNTVTNSESIVDGYTTVSSISSFHNDFDTTTPSLQDSETTTAFQQNETVSNKLTEILNSTETTNLSGSESLQPKLNNSSSNELHLANNEVHSIQNIEEPTNLPVINADEDFGTIYRYRSGSRSLKLDNGNSLPPKKIRYSSDVMPTLD
ncbi:mucin-2-like [Stomoxys calcitrans]|uniref:mucin-2-like n=1 Tax=Stomoxys calcitrans TaxID=35570 RepID=UPI0027E2FD4C|nr:mucin-2-like [Stomoxys calcitrans]